MRSLPMTAVLVGAIVGGLGLVQAPGLSSGATTETRCEIKRGRVVEQTRIAKVVRRFVRTPDGRRVRLYGCAFKQNRVYRIADVDLIYDVQIAGGFAVYGWQVYGDDPASGFANYDLTTGERRSSWFVGGRNDGAIGSFVLKPNGSIAWEHLQFYDASYPSGSYVWINDAAGERQINARLSERGSLALSANGQRIYWMSLDGLQSAPIN